MLDDMPKYVPLEQRAVWLIDKGRAAWQEVQRVAMLEDELVDSAILLGHDLWLPHHETDGSRFGVTLRVAIHVPPDAPGDASARLATLCKAIEESGRDDRGFVRIGVELR
jgi:hypothetical protein